jgi:RNA polymerase sigma factor (sigma-70 family)
VEDWKPDIAKLMELDDAEWVAVERNFCGRLLAYALRRAGDHQAAEDIVQETMLGAVRGIGDFDDQYTFEQYIFGICRNRTIDHLRRRRTMTIQEGKDEDGLPGLEAMARTTETPSAIVRGIELSGKAREILGDVLRDWVDETWEQKEFVRLMVIEALFSGGWRNRDTWRVFDLRDETAVAGIKFRALKRLRQLVAVRESGSDVLPVLEAAAKSGKQGVFDVDVQAVWRERRVSCPARHWLARLLAGTLEPAPAEFVRFHVEEMNCPWCRASLDDLSRAESEGDLDDLLQRVRESTMRYLRSRTMGR